jgi:hypothetical protein
MDADALFAEAASRLAANDVAAARALFARVPMTAGEKLIASRWIRERPFID